MSEAHKREDERQHTLAMQMVEEEEDIAPSFSPLSAFVDISLDSDNQDGGKRFEEIVDDKIRKKKEHVDLQQEEQYGEIIKDDEISKSETKSEESKEYQLEENQSEQEQTKDLYEELEEEHEINNDVEKETDISSFDTEDDSWISFTHYNDKYTSERASALAPQGQASSIRSPPEIPNLELQQIYIQYVSPSGNVNFINQSMENPGNWNNFKFPIFNSETQKIYLKHIGPSKTYYMKEDSTSKIGPEIYDFSTKRNLNFEIFKEVAKTLNTPSKLPKVNQQAEAVICYAIRGTNEVYVNFDKNCTSLISYLLKIAAEDLLSEPNFSFQEGSEFIPGVVYALISRRTGEYCRVVMAPRQEERARTFRKVREERRQKEMQEEKYLDLSDEEKQRRENIRQKERETQQKFIIVQDIDSGKKYAVSQSCVHPLSEICEELNRVPPQAKKIIVRYLDNDPENLAQRLYECYKESKVVIVKQPREFFQIKRNCVDLLTV